VNEIPEEKKPGGLVLSIKRLVSALGIAAILCAMNWASKAAAERYLAGKGTVNVIGDFLVLFYAKNSGAFLSLGRALEGVSRALFLIILPAALVVVLLGYAISPKHTVGRAKFIAASMVAAGGISNIAERVLYGSVVDYINAGIGALRTGVLNLADLQITVGIILFVLLKDGPRPEPSSEAGAKPQAQAGEAEKAE
jgi:signal peptidase II